MGLEDITDLLVSFIKTADPQVVAAICICTYMLYRAVGLPQGYRHETLSLVSFALSVPITLAFSFAEEATWGGRYLGRAIIQNGSVSVVMWLFVGPQVFKRWPHLLHSDLTESEIEAVKRIVKDRSARYEDARDIPTVEHRAMEDAQRRDAAKGNTPPL